MAPPWPGGARPSRAQGCDFRGSPRRCSRTRPPYRVGAVPRNACNRRNTCARRGGRRRIEYAREPTHIVLLSDHYCMRYPVDAHRQPLPARRTKSWTVTDQPSLLARIELSGCAHGLPLQPLGDTSDPEIALRDCGADHQDMRRVLCGLREAILEQVGTDQTDRLSRALSDALNALSA